MHVEQWKRYWWREHGIRLGNSPSYKLRIPYFHTASEERLIYRGKQVLLGIRFGIQANKTGIMLWNGALLMQIGIDRWLAYSIAHLVSAVFEANMSDVDMMLHANSQISHLFARHKVLGNAG